MALGAIGVCEPTAAVRAVPGMIKLIGSPNPAIQQEACKTLGRLESLSAEAIQSLLKVAWSEAKQTDESTREAAANAVCQIDPSGQLVYGAASDLRDLIRLRDLVAGISVARDPIVKNLTTMITTLADGPAPGRRRMLMRDIVTYIFGGPNSSQERNLRYWIEARRLRAISISQGLYDVDIGDLEMMRRLHKDDSAGEAN